MGKNQEILNLTKNLSVLLLSLLIGGLIAEGIVRLFYIDKINLFPRYHTDAKYGDYTVRRLRPDSEFWHTSVDGTWKFITNRQGYRSKKDFNYDKPEGKIRIISLGDSHTLGFEIRQDYTFSVISEKYLLKHGINAEVYNMGMSGFSTAEELVVLENEAIKYKPDFVVVGFFVNDFEDNIKTALFKLNGDSLIVNKKVRIPGVKILNAIYRIPGIKFLSENSYFYSLLFNTIWNNAKKILLRKAQADLNTEFAIATKNEFSDYELKLAKSLLKRMYNFCNINDIKFIIVDIPKADNNGFVSSMSYDFKEYLVKHSDFFIDSESILVPYSDIVEIHQLHGQSHITEFTHMFIGLELGKVIRQTIENEHNVYKTTHK